MSDELDLDAIEARVNVATPGPWTARGEPFIPDILAPSQLNGYCEPEHIAHLDDGEYINNPNKYADAEFITHARDDVPALVAEVRRLRAVAKPYIALHAERLEWDVPPISTTPFRMTLPPGVWMLTVGRQGATLIAETDSAAEPLHRPQKERDA